MTGRNCRALCPDTYHDIFLEGLSNITKPSVPIPGLARDSNRLTPIYEPYALPLSNPLVRLLRSVLLDLRRWGVPRKLHPFGRDDEFVFVIV